MPSGDQLYDNEEFHSEATTPQIRFDTSSLGEVAMITRVFAIAVGQGAVMLALGACTPAKPTAPAAPAETVIVRQLPAYTPSGQLVLPKNFEKWVFVGAPLTPNILNNGKANFPEFHNVYIEPASYEIYKRTGAFPEGTMFFKELQLLLPPNEFPDGSRVEPSGRGYFPGKFNGADVTVKDTKRYATTGGWGYYNFNHFEPKAATAKLRSRDECSYCHEASAKKDDVWTQFYPRLDNWQSATGD
jgi:hypothetical protein